MKKYICLMILVLSVSGIVFAQEPIPSLQDAVLKSVPASKLNPDAPNSTSAGGTNSASVEKLLKDFKMTPLMVETPVMEAKVRAVAGEFPVKVRPAKKISTSDPLLKEGDYVEFQVVEDAMITADFGLKKGEIVKGLITKLVDNGFNGSQASIVIEQFEIIRDSGEKLYLIGEIKKTGANHDKAIESSNYILGPAAFWIRGGEVHFDPEKDVFTIYLNNIGQAEKL